MSQNTTRVLVVDDALTYRKIIRDILAKTPGVDVVGVAGNGKIALQKIEQLHPDLLTLDLEMPEVDGLEVLRRLKAAKSDVGAIMLSAFTSRGAKATVAALDLGAFDFVLKPTGSGPDESAAQLQADLCPKILAYSRYRQVHGILCDPHHASSTPAATEPHAPPPISDVAPRIAGVATGQGESPRVVALGISTGGPQALATMMPQLPGDLATPLLIVQHMPPMFTKSLADSLNAKCALTVVEGEQGQVVEPGCAIVAPGGKQMKVTKDGSRVIVRITDDPPENSCRPSVDYLFRSVANTYGGAALAVIMTGMGDDGALGCRLLKRRGAGIIAQDEASCVVYGMPRAPAQEGLADAVLPLDRIAGQIVRMVGQGVPA
ncbi:MAG: chemotaxis response regulator protein-glutamate methylesterase [Phycisphaerae bacterium]